MRMLLWNATATAAFLVALGVLTLRWLWSCGVQLPAPFSMPMPVREGRNPSREELAQVFLAALVFRAVFFLGSWFLYHFLSGEALGLSELPDLWLRWDAPHYVKLVELGYGGYLEDGQPLFLVFFPLYVWLTRALTVLIPSPAVAGLTVSAVCFAGGCVYLYRLGCVEYGRSTARRTLVLLAAYPFSFFFGGVMTESLFLLTTSAALWHIRRHEWGRFAVWGAFAALTRMMGLILIGAALAELGSAMRLFAPCPAGERKTNWITLCKRLPLLFSPLLGSAAYLALNAHVTGDPFAFTQMQEHWSQGFQWFPSVLAYLARYAFTWDKISTRWEMWLPELLLFPIFSILLWRSWKNHRSMLTLYGFVYFILNYCLSWLLSAGRYLACDLPCFLFAAAALEDKPQRTGLLVGGMAILQVCFLYRYFCWGQVM